MNHLKNKNESFERQNSISIESVLNSSNTMRKKEDLEIGYTIIIYSFCEYYFDKIS
jgi:hypothetical protein